ncbi:MAG: universal stress protein, partial [Synechococcaceae cyanobacterium]|nr:universal stress protein [Synechococcaceae cyanobacterium]
GVPGRSLLRVDSDEPAGIARAALEQGADLVVVGVGVPDRLGRWLFGDLVASLCRQAHCPVVMARLNADPARLGRVLVPVKDLTAGALEQFQLAERFAASAPARSGDPPVAITLLHVHDPRLPGPEREALHRQLQRWLPQGSGRSGAVPVALELVGAPNVSAAILRRSRDHDLVILRSQRRMVEGLPIPASDRASALLDRLRCSTLVISDPLH